MEAAVERLRQHTFELRDKRVQRPNVRDGMLIKVGIRGERFWCRVKRVCEDGALLAVVDNDLIKSHWRCGDEIVVQNNHVLETSDPKDMAFASLLAALGSVKDATMVWRELRFRQVSRRLGCEGKACDILCFTR